jgi:hypothetical protein
MIPFTAKLFASMLAVLLISLLFHAPIIAPRKPANLLSHLPQSSGEPNFRVELHSLTEHGPQIVLTNLSEEPLTACFLRISFWTKEKPSGIFWDAFIQNVPPIAKDADVSMPLRPVIGKRYPDKFEVAAAVWADGTTSGSPDELKRIFSIRAHRAAQLDRIITLAQTGLQQEWTREQYLDALAQASSVSSEAYALKSTLEANPNLDTKPRTRQRTIQTMLDYYTRQRDALRQSKPDFQLFMNRS